MERKNWYALDVEQTCSELDSDLNKGLTFDEVVSRLKKYGVNSLKEAPPRSLLSMFVAQLKEALVLILIAAAAISCFLGEWSDAAVILAIVLVNAALGAYQERKAEQSLRALKKMTKPTAKVIRDGVVTRFDVEKLVPGDLVLLEAGDSVPADIRLTEVVSLKVNESILTGESVPVEKAVEPIAGEEVPLGDRRNMAFMGTTVASGRGGGLVVETGMRTELGRIAEMLQDTEPDVTPLQRRLAELGKILGLAAGVIVLVVFAAGIWRGERLLDMLMIAISLAVAAVPEGLPAVVTIVLSLGVIRMSRRMAVVRRLPAVETLGAVTVICTDKTGTLTKNEMTVTRLYAGGESLNVTGSGYLPKGDFLSEDGETVDPQRKPCLMLMLLGGLLNSDARLEKIGESWRVIGDPTEGALVVLAAKAGLTKDEAEKVYPRLAEIPFDSSRKLMTTFHMIEGEVCSFTKGAPDVVLSRCSGIIGRSGGTAPLAEEKRAFLSEVNSRLASQGLRVLALALRKWPAVPEALEPDAVENDLAFVGFFAIQDPARPEARDAVAIARRAGIRTVMITGDHRETALAIARELDIWRDGDGILTGMQLCGMDDERLKDEVDRTTIYARVSPEDKLRIVGALKAHGQVVAMTGDGVNDAPALKKADIGVAMGITGTDVAKEASDMVLLDDNFATIVRAVEEGRTIYGNIRKAVQYLLSCNIGEIVTIFFAIILGLRSPLTAIQLLWLNLITDGLPALSLGLEPPERGVMNRPPRKPWEGIMSGGVGFNIIWQGAVIGLLSLAVYWLAMSLGKTLEEARTMTFAAMALMQLVHSFNARSLKESVFSLGIFTNRSLVWAFLGSLSLQLCVLFIPLLRKLFEVVLLSVGEWLIIIGFSLVPLLVVEMYKGLKRIASKA